MPARISQSVAGKLDSAPATIAALRPVDLGHLSRYTLGNRSLEREVLQLFAGQIWGMFNQLRTAGDEKDWRRAAHTIKGSARAIGAWRLADAAEKAEAIELAAPERPGAMAMVEREIVIVTRFIQARG